MEMDAVKVRTIFETAISASGDKDVPYDMLRAVATTHGWRAC
jgi:hypothetical protein